MMRSGLFIVLYGINGIGKSTQVKKLGERLRSQGEEFVCWKYPAYDLAPTGPMINDYLRNENPFELSPREFQIIQATNRTHREYMPGGLRTHIKNGTHVVAEDYIGTSLAWGIGENINKGFLTELNSYLHKPDIEILLDGEPFVGSEEKQHRHENDHNMVDRVRDIHLDLAREFGWSVVPAEQKIEDVHEDIWSIVEPRLLVQV